jgi:hypothetical protein
MPALPIEAITTAKPSRIHAGAESGAKATADLEWKGACTGDNFVVSHPGVKQHGAIMGMQEQCNKTGGICRLPHELPAIAGEQRATLTLY